MNDGRHNPIAPLGINTQLSPSNTSFDNNSWDAQFNQNISLQPPPSPSGSINSSCSSSSSKPGGGNTFVHKLYNMVVDNQYQHLIAWTYTGLSFIVCNITEFSSDVLPKHFKHNNFSSFVRQLNMYGFHKVNKSPRGHKTMAENQIWEFSHPKFLRNRPELLDEIKRKALENDSNKRDSSTNISSHMSMMQMSQSDMMQQITHLQENLTQVMKELTEAKKQQNLQQEIMKDMLDFMSKQYGSLPFQNLELFNNTAIKDDPPPIFITSADNNSNSDNSQFTTQGNTYLSINDQHQQQQQLSAPNSPLSSTSSPILSPNHVAEYYQLSPQYLRNPILNQQNTGFINDTNHPSSPQTFTSN